MADEYGPVEEALADWLMRRCGMELSPLSIREGAEQILAAEQERSRGLEEALTEILRLPAGAFDRGHNSVVAARLREALSTAPGAACPTCGGTGPDNVDRDFDSGMLEAECGDEWHDRFAPGAVEEPGDPDAGTWDHDEPQPDKDV